MSYKIQIHILLTRGSEHKKAIKINHKEKRLRGCQRAGLHACKYHAIFFISFFTS